VAADGFLNLLKPPGMTSHDAAAWLRRSAGTAVGHAGTLDRAAAGVLVLCVGKARRFSRWAMEGDKAYVGEVTFGITTDTLDAEGAVTGECDASDLTAPQVARALAAFEGEIEQQAPAYSAVHAGGVRLYQLARQGRTPPRRTRRVRIMSARVLDFTPGRHPRARIAIECSKGTYIRSLAADLGDAVGCGGCLSFLVRTRAGAFDVADSLTVEQAQRAIEQDRLQDILCPLDTPLQALPALMLEAREANLLRHGSVVLVPAQLRGASGLTRVYDQAGSLIGLAEVEGEQLRPRVVVAE
jgi:tRNA pseudouridine55 synthase